MSDGDLSITKQKIYTSFWVRKLMEKTDKYVVYPSFFLYAYEYAANTDAQSTLVSHFKFYFEKMSHNVKKSRFILNN